MTSKEAALLLMARIKRAQELWGDHEAFERTGGEVSMTGHTAKDLLALIKDQEAELAVLRSIFDKDMLNDNEAMRYAKMKERERCEAIVLKWAAHLVEGRKSPLLNAAKQIAKGD